VWWFLCKCRLVKYPTNKLDNTVVNGNTNQVGTREDLVAALQNNLLKVEELQFA